MSQIPVDCLYEIIEYFEDDKKTLYSCLLVNRLFCEISVKIFWRNVLSYNTSNFSTLITCLPYDSKNLLYENEIIILTPTLIKSPTFNYAKFCKVLSVNRVHFKIRELLKKNQPIYLSQKRVEINTNIVVQEICKMIINRSSLKSLIFSYYPTLTFTFCPEDITCFNKLSELRCQSDFSSEFFYQLSQICHTITLLDIKFYNHISNGLADLISIQKNLKHFRMTQSNYLKGIPSLIANLPNNLIKLNIYGGNFISLSFITKFSNLQELELSFGHNPDFGDYEKLLNFRFSRLQIFTIWHLNSRSELIIKFLEINGKNLKEFYANIYNDDINLAIIKFCPNLRKLSIRIIKYELETLKLIFKSCQHLESIKVWCGSSYLNEKEVLEAILKYSHENIIELILHMLHEQYNARFEPILSDDLDAFFISWMNRIPRKPLSFKIITRDCYKSLDKIDSNMKIINKYIKLGVIKDFKVINDNETFTSNY